MTLPHPRAFALASLFGLFVGCSGSPSDNGPKGPEVSGVNVSGVVLDNGKPLKLRPRETVNVSFTSPTDPLLAGGADVGKDGSFKIIGPHAKGLPAGKWRVSLQSDNDGTGEDRFAASLGLGNTVLVAELAGAGDQVFEIDVASKKIIKK